MSFGHRFELNVMPDVGHAEACNFPDQSHLKWRYKQDFSGVQRTRDNTAIFLDAAETIYAILCEFTGKPCNWLELSGKIREGLAFPTDILEGKYLKYQKLFPAIHLGYDEEEWRRAALRGENFDWIYFEKHDYKEWRYQYNGDMKWFYFHRAAYEQRIFVLQNIRNDLL